MDAMTAANGRRALMLKGAFFQSGKQPVNSLDQQITCPRHLHRQGGVKNVR